MILGSDPAWENVLIRNDFTQLDVAIGSRHPPWDPPERPAAMPAPGAEWTDADDARAVAWLHRHYGMKVATSMVAEAGRVVAAKVIVHPVREYLGRIRWDGEARLGHWLARYLGAKDDDYAGAVGSWWLTSAIARVMQPGCQADHVIVLEGAQGIGKSRSLRTLVPDQAWFTDHIPDLNNKDAFEQLFGIWIVELSELDAMRKADISRVKAFVSQPSNRFRRAYGRRSASYPRQCVFAGTTNESQYLHDQTGNRRFWPVKCGKINLAGLAQARDALWAEALVAYQDGKRWWPDEGDTADVAREQDARRVIDPWETVIAERIAAAQPNQLFTRDILDQWLDVPTKDQSRAHQMRVAAVLKLLGWQQTWTGWGLARTRVWTREDLRP
jgi:putative DNA primase/helicase